MQSDLAYFFSTVRNPQNVSDVVTTLAAGHQLQVDRLPTELLPAVVLLASIGMATYREQIVDSYSGLLRRTEQVWADTQFTHRVFDHPQLALVSLITMSAGSTVTAILANSECAYMDEIYRKLTTTDLESLVPWLL